jgi:hypothetical protein
MPAATSLTTAASRLETPIASGLASQSDQEVNSLFVRCLGSVSNSDKKPLCYRIRHTQDGLIREAFSHRYTILFRKVAIGRELATREIFSQLPVCRNV